jgi:Na+/H+-dicarboxylate symporter
MIYKKYGTHLILLSVVLAIVCGVYTPSIFKHIGVLGDIFINLLKLFALPLICSALIVALGAMGSSIGNLKSLARNVVFYMILSEVIAVTIALVLFNVFKPGVGISPDLILQGQPLSESVASGAHKFNITQFLLSIVPQNIFESLAKFDLLPVVIFAIMFGIGCAYVKSAADPVIKFFTATRDIANICLHGVMCLAPIGIFALVGRGVADASLGGKLGANLFALLIFVMILLLGLFLHGLWQFILVLLLTKQSGLHVLKKSIPVFATAFATSSSVATLPIAMETADSLKSKPYVTEFMLPLCASINIGGMMMYEVAAALFFSQILGVDLALGEQILVAVACILCGMAEGGIPETSLVSLVVIFRIVNVPLTAISILLPLDRIIDRFRTMVNIFGNMCGVIIVSRFLTGKTQIQAPIQTEIKTQIQGRKASK